LEVPKDAITLDAIAADALAVDAIFASAIFENAIDREVCRSSPLKWAPSKKEIAGILREELFIITLQQPYH
jgi:hypothetical protein